MLHRRQERHNTLRLPAGTLNIPFLDASGTDIVPFGVVVVAVIDDAEAAVLGGGGVFELDLVDGELTDAGVLVHEVVEQMAAHAAVLVFDGQVHGRVVRGVFRHHAVAVIPHAAVAAVDPFPRSSPDPGQVVRLADVVELLDRVLVRLTGYWKREC